MLHCDHIRTYYWRLYVNGADETKVHKAFMTYSIRCAQAA